MSKFILMTVLAFIANAGIIQAQNSQSRFWDGLKFGIKAGANYSNVYDSQGDQFTADGKYGFVGGVFLEVPITDYIGVRPEILYSQKRLQSIRAIPDRPIYIYADDRLHRCPRVVDTETNHDV